MKRHDLTCQQENFTDEVIIKLWKLWRLEKSRDMGWPFKYRELWKTMLLFLIICCISLGEVFISLPQLRSGVAKKMWIEVFCTLSEQNLKKPPWHSRITLFPLSHENTISERHCSFSVGLRAKNTLGLEWTFQQVMQARKQAVLLKTVETWGWLLEERNLGKLTNTDTWHAKARNHEYGVSEEW